MTVFMRCPDEEERLVQDLGYGTHDLPAGKHRIRTPDGILRDLEADDAFCITVERHPVAAPSFVLSLLGGRFSEMVRTNRVPQHEQQQENVTMHKIGDLVKLKSGGPVMTVDESSSKTVNVKWFDSNATQVQSATFAQDAVVPAFGGDPSNAP